MIELTEEQRRCLDCKEQPPVVVDSHTGQDYLLVRREIYENTRRYLTPLGCARDNPVDDDLILNKS
jgi:hypothetical protein